MIYIIWIQIEKHEALQNCLNWCLLRSTLQSYWFPFNSSHLKWDPCCLSLSSYVDVPFYMGTELNLSHVPRYISFSLSLCLSPSISVSLFFSFNISLYVLSFNLYLSPPPPLRSTVVRASARVREPGVRSPTASHQRRKNWEVCAYQLGAWH